MIAEIVIIVCTILGGIAAMVYLYEKYFFLVRKKVSWRRIRTGTDILHDKMFADKFIPNVVVGIDRAGGIVGALIAANWRLYPYCVIERTHTKKGDQKIVEVMDTIGIDLNDKNVLLVDSEIYTGDTMQAVTEFLRKKYPRIRMKTMVIFKSVMARFDVDYFAYKIKGYKVMPWVYRKEYMLAYHPPEK